MEQNTHYAICGRRQRTATRKTEDFNGKIMIKEEISFGHLRLRTYNKYKESIMLHAFDEINMNAIYITLDWFGLVWF